MTGVISSLLLATAAAAAAAAATAASGPPGWCLSAAMPRWCWWCCWRWSQSDSGDTELSGLMWCRSKLGWGSVCTV